MNNIKLIFSDVDGTLVVTGGTNITTKLKRAMQKCSENNIEFVLCSGRPTPNLINIAKELNEGGLSLKYVSGFNGSEIYDLINEKYLYQNLIVDTVEITKELDEVNIDYMLYKGDTIYSTNLLNKYCILEADLTNLKVNELEYISSSPKVLGLVNPVDMSSTLKKVRSSLRDYTVTNSTPYYLEITNKGVDKGSGLLKMAEILDITTEQVMCFGDSGNDISMFNICENAVAVANATEEVKKLASTIIDSVHDDGVAEYILKNLA